MNCGEVIGLIGAFISFGGILISIGIFRKTNKISENLTTHARNKAFSRIRKNIINQLNQLTETLSLIQEENIYYIKDKFIKLDRVLASVLTQDYSLSAEYKEKITYIRNIIKNGEPEYTSIAQELHDIISKLEGEEAYDKER